MDTPLLGRVLRGLGSQGYNQAVQIAVRLAEVPVMLHFWGAQLYGEWLMLAAIPAYLAIGDGGFASAASRDMSMRSSAGDRTGALAVFQSTAVLLLTVSFAVLTVAFVIAAWAPLGAWLGFHVIDSGTLTTVLLLLIVHVLVGFQGGLINGGFWCSGRYPLGMTLSSTTQLIEFLCLMAAVASGGSPVRAAAAYLAGRTLGTVLTGFVMTRATPWLSYGVENISLREIRRLARPAFASLAFPLGNALNIQGMRLIVGIVLGPAAVASFVPLRTLSNFAAQPRLIVMRLIEPELGFAYGAGNGDLFTRLFFRGSQMTLWFSIVIAALLMAITPWLWSVWTRGQAEMNWPLLFFLTGAAVLNGLWSIALMVPYATNRHGRIAMIYAIVYGGGALIAAYASSAVAGLPGLGIVLLMAEVVMALFVLPASLEMAQQKGAAWLRSIVQPPFFVFTHLRQLVTGFRTESAGRSKRG